MAVVLIVLAVVAALVALEARNLSVSLGAAVAIGLLLAVACLYARAFDVAVILLVGDAIPAWILAKRAAGLKGTSVAGRDLVGLVVTVALLVILLAVSFKALGGLPKFGEPAFGTVAGSPGVAYGGAIAGVFFRYRLFDILACAVVLLVGVAGARAAIPRGAAGLPGRSGEEV